jgi:hypothetical protein
MAYVRPRQAIDRYWDFLANPDYCKHLKNKGYSLFLNTGPAPMPRELVAHPISFFMLQ